MGLVVVDGDADKYGQQYLLQLEAEQRLWLQAEDELAWAAGWACQHGSEGSWSLSGSEAPARELLTIRGVADLSLARAPNSSMMERQMLVCSGSNYPSLPGPRRL